MQPIKISIPRATPEELQRGVAAAMQVFRDARVKPAAAAEGRFRREAWDIGGFRNRDITNAHLAAAAVWDRADTAALEAACAGWDEDCKPQSADLEIIVDPEAQLADRPTAVNALRKIAETDPRKWSTDEDRRLSIYAGIIAGQIENPFRVRDLIDPVTIAFHSVTSAQHRRQSLEAPREHLHDVIETLIEASELRH
ncbi:hypothetical protein ACSBOB_26915 [Mesorhizobium sp. ASY16-5R]|uniref:hypothetical protein n=1 Tax=Mesorhizobium sp. ASY16-5R TaxID=3445772 RepID=UPI003FA0B656